MTTDRPLTEDELRALWTELECANCDQRIRIPAHAWKDPQVTDYPGAKLRCPFCGDRVLYDPAEREPWEGPQLADAGNVFELGARIEAAEVASARIGMCPLCAAPLPNDGSCCDSCDWVLQQ